MASPTSNEDDRHRIYAALGEALWALQELEETLARLIALVFRMPANASVSEARAVLGSVRAGTLGRLVNEVKAAIQIDFSVESFLTRFVKERNWMVHHSWRTHGESENPEDVVEVLYRIGRVLSDAREFNSLFNSIIHSWATDLGISQEEIAQLAAEVQAAEGEA